MSPTQRLLLRLIQAIVNDDTSTVVEAIESSPLLARESLAVGATRQTARDFYFQEIEHYFVAGDTLLHAAAAGYRNCIAEELLRRGANIAAANRRGAAPLHYAADGAPGSRAWNPEAQFEMIAFLIRAGANPNTMDGSGVAPLHRAVRQRCSTAVDALLRNGADAGLKNKSGSTPLHLAVQNTGRGGTGSPESKALQRKIVELLLKAGANPNDRDGRGKTVRECAHSDCKSLLDLNTERN
jgi:ankyrin repeat protein